MMKKVMMMIMETWLWSFPTTAMDNILGDKEINNPSIINFQTLTVYSTAMLEGNILNYKETKILIHTTSRNNGNTL